MLKPFANTTLTEIAVKRLSELKEFDKVYFVVYENELINLAEDHNFINLEVYKEMAYKTLENTFSIVSKKWNIIDILVIHRFGKLNINEKIVLVATFSLHRKDSFEACNFIMDYLKQDAPFWKKEFYNDSYKWLQNTKSKN